jgi:hypothetical protein
MRVAFEYLICMYILCIISDISCIKCKLLVFILQKDTNRQLQWLKEIKKAHGSVEVTSLMQAEAINANGIFTVGKNAWKRDADAQKMDETLLVQ